MISIARPLFGEEEKEAVARVMDTGMIACGETVTEFEQAFSGYIGMPYGVATTSGTAALELALRALHIGPGDKVLTTPFSFIASTNAILYVGATPVFGDIDPFTFHMTLESMERKLEEQPDIKALLIVHLYGQACDMQRISQFARDKKLLLIEDCAQAHGALCGKQMAGSFGDASAFSFYPTKNMSTGEGGMVLTPHVDVANELRLLINHGMIKRYHHETIGYNLRMTNIAAAIGICQLRKLPDFNAKRRFNAEFLNKSIKHISIQTPIVAKGCDHVYSQYTLRVNSQFRPALIEHMEKNQIGYGVFYPLTIPEQACYKHSNFEKVFAVADRIKHQVLSVPVHPALTSDELYTVSRILNNFPVSEEDTNDRNIHTSERAR